MPESSRSYFIFSRGLNSFIRVDKKNAYNLQMAMTEEEVKAIQSLHSRGKKLTDAALRLKRKMTREEIYKLP